MNKEFKYISLDLTPESREKLLNYLPTLHCFQNACYCNSESDILLRGVVLVSDSEVNNKDLSSLATDLANKYFEFIDNGLTHYKMSLTHLGWDDCVMAFKCENDLVGIQPDKQLLVISTYNYHNSREAKSINKWIELKPIELEGILTIH